MTSPHVDATSLEWATFWVGLVGSLGTIAALVTAIVLGAHEVRTLRVERSERDDNRRTEEDRRRREQASSVSAQLSLDIVPVPGLGLDEGRGGLHYLARAIVTNASALPVFDLEFMAPDPDPSMPYTTLGLWVVGGGKSGEELAGQHPERSLDGLPLEVRFTDAAGVRWERQASGFLDELRAPRDDPAQLTQGDS